MPGTVRVYFNSSDAMLRLLGSQSNSQRQCYYFEYALNSVTDNNGTFVLTSDQNFLSKNESFLSINIDFLDCPVGFSLTPPDSGKCVCDRAIEFGIECIINNQSFVRLRTSSSWLGIVGNSSSNSHPTGVVFYPNCPIGCCSPHDVYFTVNTMDYQCEPNRTGLLCGKCKEGYSLTFGHHPKCTECSNIYLLLVIPMAAAGVLLIAILFMFNLTVTEGTINGLIFYSNVIGMSHTLFSMG